MFHYRVHKNQTLDNVLSQLNLVPQLNQCFYYVYIMFILFFRLFPSLWRDFISNDSRLKSCVHFSLSHAYYMSCRLFLFHLAILVKWGEECNVWKDKNLFCEANDTKLHAQPCARWSWNFLTSRHVRFTHGKRHLFLGSSLRGKCKVEGVPMLN
jgi:hypothetical protein